MGDDRRATTTAVVSYLLAHAPTERGIDAVSVAHELGLSLPAVVLQLQRLRRAGWVTAQAESAGPGRRPTELGRCRYVLTVAGRTRATHALTTRPAPEASRGAHPVVDPLLRPGW